MAKNIGRNMLLSGASWLIPAVVAFVAVPIVVRGLGANVYGVVALAGAVAGYLGVLDLGLGQGAVRYLSVFVSLRHGRAMRQLVVSVLAWFVAAGVIGTAIIWLLAPWLAGSLLKVPPALVRQTVVAFRLGGAAFGLAMIVAMLSLLPPAFLRYDLVSVLTVTISTIGLAGPAVLVKLGYGLLPVMWFAVTVNGVACVCWGLVAVHLLRQIPNEGPAFGDYWREFLGFSLKNGVNRVWSAVQNPTSQLVVGMTGGAAQASYFQVPLTISTKVTDLLYQMSTVLLPTGSQLVAEGEHGLLLDLYERSSRLFYVLNASVVGAVVVFSAPLLGYWIGPRYAQAGAVAFALLVLAAGLNAVSMTASQVNMALGRPGVNLAFSLANSAVNLGTVYSLTVAFGITGTALSGLLAAGVVPFFLHYSHRKTLATSSWRVFRDCYLRATVAIVAASCLSWFVLRQLASGLLATIGLVGVAAVASVLASTALGAVTRADWTSLKDALRSASRSGSPGAPPRAGGGGEDG
jgi:O-antigen/teichoic acid export membrane protein